MSKIGKLSFICCLLLLFSVQAQRISVQSSVLPNPVSLGEVLTYTVEVKASGEIGYVSANNPPEADKLVLIQVLPFEGRSQSSINGRVEQSVSLTWRFQPTEVGTATIQGMGITVSGVTYRTNPIRVRVVEPSSTAPTTNPFSPTDPSLPPPPVYSNRDKGADLFIRAVPSANRIYQGQQMAVTYFMYVKIGVDIMDTRLADSWDAEGFWRVELERDKDTSIETIEGIRYQKIAIKRVSVFPTRSGTVTIDPMEVEGSYRKSILDALDSFGMPDMDFKPFKIKSAPVQVQSAPLPPLNSPHFNGSVGKFKMEVWYDKKVVNVGDALQIKVKISGTGNIKALKAPSLELPTVIESYDPQSQIKLDKSGAALYGSKIFTYTLIPKANGQYQIPALQFTYFDANQRQYQTLRYPSQKINVTGNSIASSSNNFPLNDIAPLITQTPSWTSANSADLHKRWGFWLILLLLPIFLLAGLAYLRTFQTKIETNVAFARERKAEPAAHKHLKIAKSMLKEGNHKLFYEELSRAVLGFYGNKYNIAEKGLTHQELNEALSVKGISAENRQLLLNLIKEADGVRFSPIQPDVHQMQQAYKSAEKLIEE